MLGPAPARAPADGASRVFLLSPARLDGERARVLLRRGARSELARRLRSDDGVAIGELCAFLSSLYFRGKLAYASAFGRAPPGSEAALVIVPGRGLVEPALRVRLADLRAIRRVPVDEEDRRYRRPLEESALSLAARLGPRGDAVLLGSVATAKYLAVLGPCLGPRLRIPREFVGRGDMSRGGLMLRCAREGTELDYVGVTEALAVRRVRRATPARLATGAAGARGNGSSSARRAPRSRVPR